MQHWWPTRFTILFMTCQPSSSFCNPCSLTTCFQLILSRKHNYWTLTRMDWPEKFMISAIFNIGFMLLVNLIVT
jgi:hypothetical protein